MAKQETVTALETLKNTRRAATSLAESADAYISTMESEPRPVVKVGDFYITYDGSLVCVVKHRSGCQCPVCGEDHDNSGTLSMFASLSPVFGELIEQQQAKTEKEHKEKQDESPEFVVVVLRGGHGIKDMQGEEPGDRYLVGADGYTLMAKLDDDSKDVATKNQLCLSGLSLRQHLTVTISASEPT